MYTHPNCNIITHMCTKWDEYWVVFSFLGMRYFDIVHTSAAKNLLTTIYQRERSYLCTIPSHPICEEVSHAWKNDLHQHHQENKGRSKTHTWTKNIIYSVSSSDSNKSTIVIATNRGPKKNQPLYKIFTCTKKITNLRQSLRKNEV